MRRPFLSCSFLNKAFDGTSIYRDEDMPVIDCLLISHDHWDHLDYPTVTALQSKIKQVICPLGVGAYFQDWDFPEEKIYEGDWDDRIALGKDAMVHVLPARHYSGRLFKENKTLWAGFAIETFGRRIFYSGDSGYGPHFSKIGAAFHGFDLVMLDCGQYDPRWAFIHMTPEEAARAAHDLGAQALMPAHVGRFAIANHAWDEPFLRLTEASRGKSYRLMTHRIGELAELDDTSLKAVDTNGGYHELGRQTIMKISVKANGKTTEFELNNSPAARDLCAQLPLSIKVENYSNNEKIFYPPEKPDTTDTPQADAQVGTLAYYAPWGDVVMSYGSFGSAAGLYELGHAVSGSEFISRMSGKIRIEKNNHP